MSNPDIEYQFDPTGRLARNAIYNEPYTLTAANADMFQFLVIRNSPFFRESIRIVVVATGRLLVPGVDYIPTHHFRKAREEYGADVYGSVTFIGATKELVGDVLVSYQTLGAPFINNHDPLLVTVVDDITKVRTADFLTIFDVPSTFPAMPHFADVDDVIGWDDVVSSIQALTDVVERNITPDHQHDLHQIKGLVEHIALATMNNGAYKTNMGSLKTSGHTGTLAVNIPKFLLETQINVELKVITNSKTYTLDISGLIPNPSSYGLGVPWTTATVRVVGGMFPENISVSFNEDGNPTIYLGDNNSVWSQTQFAISSVLIDAAGPHHYNKDWACYITDEAQGTPLSQYVLDGTVI